MTRAVPPGRLPAGVWAMGFASLLMDVSSELVHSLLPLYLVGVLGAGMVTVGLVEGVAEATASILKVFSGTLSDRMGRRKPLMLAGYGLSAFVKPLFPMASSVAGVLAARFGDRVGKGLRGAPRDALIADLTDPGQRGAAYGLRQALDSVGAVLGPLLAVALMAWMASDIQRALWVAVVPAAAAVALLAVAVREPSRERAAARAAPAAPGAVASPRFVLALDALRRLPARVWLVVLLGAVFSLARFSEAFLVLRARDAGLTLAQVPLVMVVMNVVYALSAFPAGALADREGPARLLLAGLIVLVGADLVLAAGTSALAVLAGAGLWGLHMGLTQGLLSKLVADAAPAELRGTAFGVFNMVSGVALLAASLLAGWLWEHLGAPATFAAGMLFAALAALGLLGRRVAAR